MDETTTRSDGTPAAGAHEAPVETTASVRRRGDRRRRARGLIDTRRAVTLAVGVASGLVLADVTAATVARLRSIIVLVLLSLFLSFAIEPAVQWLQQRGVRRGIGTALVFVAALLLAAGAVAAISGLVAGQARALADAAPRLLDDLAARAEQLPAALADPVSDFLADQSSSVPDRIAATAGALGRQALGLGSSILTAVFGLLTVALLTFYLVADGPKLREQLSRRLDHEAQRELLELWELAIAKTGGYVYSRLLLAVASAVFHTLAFTMLGLEYAAALGVFVGLLSSLVPVVGTYLAGTLPIVVAVVDPDVSVIAVIAVIVLYQQLENYALQPLITRHTMSLHPAVAFLSVLVGAALLGAIGALLALPAAAIVAALIAAYGEEHDVVDHELTTVDSEDSEDGDPTT